MIGYYDLKQAEKAQKASRRAHQSYMASKKTYDSMKEALSKKSSDRASWLTPEYLVDWGIFVMDRAELAAKHAAKARKLMGIE